MDSSQNRSGDTADTALYQIALPDGLYIPPRELAEALPQETQSSGEQLTFQLVLMIALLIISAVLSL